MTRSKRVVSWHELRTESLRRYPGMEAELARERERTLREIADYEATMAELRRARKMTQVALAEALGTSQGEVSRIERQTDLYMSTLSRYIEAMGGELELVARFRDGERVAVKLSELERVQSAAPDRGVRAAAARRSMRVGLLALLLR